MFACHHDSSAAKKIKLINELWKKVMTRSVECVKNAGNTEEEVIGRRATSL
jgi:hypothetical protein